MDETYCKLLREQVEVQRELSLHNAGEISKIFSVLISITERIDKLEAQREVS